MTTDRAGRRARAAAALPLVVVLASCGSSPQAQAPSTSASIPSTDPLCERFIGIYGAWRAAWLRDVETRTGAGVEVTEAQNRGEIALTSPFRRAVAQEIARDGRDAIDPNLQAAMKGVTASPESAASYDQLAAVCGATGPFTQ